MWEATWLAGRVTHSEALVFRGVLSERGSAQQGFQNIVTLIELRPIPQRYAVTCLPDHLSVYIANFHHSINHSPPVCQPDAIRLTPLCGYREQCTRPYPSEPHSPHEVLMVPSLRGTRHNMSRTLIEYPDST